jgi:hypothetical protein
LAINVIATPRVVDPIAVANGKAVLGAVGPDGMLHEPRKHLRKGGIEGSGINLGSNRLKNVAAPSGLIASRSVRVVSAEPPQDAGPVQKVVNQGVDHNKACTDFEPAGPALPRPEEQHG